MDSARYLIVGGGLAGGSAVEAIRSRDRDGRIVLVSDEQHLPYDRVPLSKGYLTGKLQRESLFLQDPKFYQQEHVEVLLGRRVQQLNADARNILLDDGREFGFERLLLATGGSPRRLPIPGGDLLGVHCLRTMDDCDAIRDAISTAAKVVIIGGGFIGCEIAASCVQKGLDTTIIELGPSLLNMVLDPETAARITEHFTEHGVHVLTNESAARFIESEGRAAGVETTAGSRILSDLVVVGIGVAPNVELAREAGLPVGNGIIVNERLEVDNTGVYAAGDAARFYSPVFGKHLRVEHYDGALKHGRAAGVNMAGGQERFAELPYFFSFMFGLRTEVWGDCTQRDSVIRRGSLHISEKGGFAQFYLSQRRVQAYVSIHRPLKEKEAAQKLILSRQNIEDASLLSDESVDLETLVKRNPI